MSKYEVYFMGDNQAVKRVGSSRTRNRDGFSGCLAALPLTTGYTACTMNGALKTHCLNIIRCVPPPPPPKKKNIIINDSLTINIDKFIAQRNESSVSFVRHLCA